MKKDQLLSIITPVYNESENIPIFFAELLSVVKQLPYRFEIVFVDDGSTDDSVEIVRALRTTADNVSVKLVQLTRNFGKEIAITAGLHAVKGQAAILIDSDLQHPVEIIPEFIDRWKRGAEIVIGVRKVHAHESLVKKFGSKFFYKFMHLVSDTPIIPHSTDYRLLDRQIVEAFSNFTEHSRITRGLIDWLGYKQEIVEFTAKPRRHGEASYTIGKLIKLAKDSFTTHSFFPLKLAGYLGTAMFIFFGFAGAIAYFESYLLNDPLNWAISGTAMLALLMLFSIGIVLSCLGLIAIYIGNIQNEVMNRPLYVVRRSRRK